MNKSDFCFGDALCDQLCLYIIIDVEFAVALGCAEGKMDGDSWEDLCQSCYRIRYQEQHYTEIPAVQGGDAGIEGFTRTGVVNQCYYPEREYSEDELYKHQRNKMTKDINKLLDKGYKGRLKDLGVPVIHEWHFVIPYYKDSRIIQHAETKWYTQISGGEKVTQATVLNVSTTLYAQWAKTAKLAKPAKLSMTAKKGRQMKVSYKKVSGASGYQIAYSTSRKFASSATKKVTTSSTSKILKNLKKGKTYYVRVRAYKTDSAGNKVYGTYSEKKSIKIKA